MPLSQTVKISITTVFWSPIINFFASCMLDKHQTFVGGKRDSAVWQEQKRPVRALFSTELLLNVHPTSLEGTAGGRRCHFLREYEDRANSTDNARKYRESQRLLHTSSGKKTTFQAENNKENWSAKYWRNNDVNCQDRSVCLFASSQRPQRRRPSYPSPWEHQTLWNVNGPASIPFCNRAQPLWFESQNQSFFQTDLSPNGPNYGITAYVAEPVLLDNNNPRINSTFCSL